MLRVLPQWKCNNALFGSIWRVNAAVTGLAAYGRLDMNCDTGVQCFLWCSPPLVCRYVRQWVDCAAAHAACLQVGHKQTSDMPACDLDKHKHMQVGEDLRDASTGGGELCTSFTS